MYLSFILRKDLNLIIKQFLNISKEQKKKVLKKILK